MNTFRRIAVAARRRAIVARAAIRRRPRTFAAAGVLVAAVALSGAGGLVLISAAPSTTSTTTNGDPAFTVRSGWTLADLQRHVEAGDVDAITAGPANATNSEGQLLARTRSGQVVSSEPRNRRGWTWGTRSEGPEWVMGPDPSARMFGIGSPWSEERGRPLLTGPGHVETTVRGFSRRAGSAGKGVVFASQAEPDAPDDAPPA